MFRRKEGGSWAADHPQGGEKSYPLAISSNRVIFPVGWCWRRLVNGDTDNVYHKAMVAREGWIASVPVGAKTGIVNDPSE